jgi:hypothetical protein
LQNSPIQLGSFDLQDFEIPQSVRFGGRHRVAIHALAGGRRIVERLGPDDDDVQFRGTFSGPAAETRARAFDNLRVSGEIVWLTWESFRRQVIVKRFTADYRSPWWISYQISCLVVRQNRVALTGGASVATIVSADLSVAMSTATGTGISLASLQAALSNANSLITGTADQIQAIAAVDSTLLGINSQVVQQSEGLTTVLPPGTNPSDLGQSYLSQVNCASALAAAVSIRGYVGRIGVNISGSNI